MPRKRYSWERRIPGHPRTWVGQQFQGIGIASETIVRVVGYERGPHNRKFLVYETLQNPKAPWSVGTKWHLYPDDFQQRFVPYDPNKPREAPSGLPDPSPADPAKLRAVPPRSRKDTH